MIELGKTQTLEAVKATANGVYLNCPGDPERNKVLLPKGQVPEGLGLGDAISVFVYKDSEDRPIATTATPLIQLHELATLKVLDTSPIGAFLDWGLSKDLFLPFKEQTRKVRKGDNVLVCLYVDKSGRLCATMKVYDYLRNDHSYQKGDRVTGTVYQISDKLGTFVALDNRYYGLIPKDNLYEDLRLGDEVSGRITGIREDGKCYMSIREKAYKQIDADSQAVFDALKEAGGFLPLHDKSDPQLIKDRLRMSKGAYKRAIGRLWKEEKIELLENGIRLVPQANEEKKAEGKTGTGQRQVEGRSGSAEGRTEGKPRSTERPKDGRSRSDVRRAEGRPRSDERRAEDRRPRSEARQTASRPRPTEKRTDDRPRPTKRRAEGRPRSDERRAEGRPRSDERRAEDRRPRSEARQTASRPRPTEKRTEDKPRTEVRRAEDRPRTEESRAEIRLSPELRRIGNRLRMGRRRM